MRLCYVDTWQRDHQKAIFHEWVETTAAQPGRTGTLTMALVEFEDGTMSRIDYRNIRFSDSETYFKTLEEKEDEDTSEPLMEHEAILGRE